MARAMLKAERSMQHYVITRDGEYVTGLSFREVYALVACRLGLARWREKGTYTPYLSHVDTWPEVDVYGVGWGTILNLTGRWPEGTDLVARSEEPGPCLLTELGNAVLDAILEIPGVSIRTGVVAGG